MFRRGERVVAQQVHELLFHRKLRFVRCTNGRLHRRVDHTRCNCARDQSGCLFQRQTLTQTIERGLRRAVCGPSCVAALRRARRHIDEHASPIVLLEQTQKCLSNDDGRDDVDLENLTKLRGRQRPLRLDRSQNSRVVDHQIDLTERIPRTRDERRDAICVREINTREEVARRRRVGLRSRAPSDAQPAALNLVTSPAPTPRLTR